MSNRIELWLDLSCPWCHGALPVMRRLLTQEAPQAEIVWRPVRLHPLAPEGVIYEDYVRRFTQDPIKLAEMRNEVEEFNSARGRVLNLDKVRRLFHPQLGHQLFALARETAGVDMWALALALWDANWRDGVDISDPDALKAALGDLVPEGLWAKLPHGAALVDADRERATAIKLDGVPRFYVNGAIIPAWLDESLVREKLRAALQASAPPGAVA